MSTFISVEHLSKSYRLGQINTPSSAIACVERTAGTFSYELQLWCSEMLGKP